MTGFDLKEGKYVDQEVFADELWPAFSYFFLPDRVITQAINLISYIRESNN